VLYSPPGRQEVPEAGPFRVTVDSSLVISAPHEVTHVRNGERKMADRGTGDLAEWLAGAVGASSIVAESKQLGDPDDDHDHPYIVRAAQLASGGGLISLHIMRGKGPEVCMMFGPNPQLAQVLWLPMLGELVDAGLRVSVNWPLRARVTTGIAQLQRRGIPAIQLEINEACFEADSDIYDSLRSGLLRGVYRIADVRNERPQDEVNTY